ncbi:MAG: uracil-DNA glycosylase family protein [Deltaproteobacteria bacterium]|nr:uracil-DNA glycosylase family protein [Deltaproteobacteria bacterium]
MVQLGNGKWERIGRLVRRKYRGTIISVDKNGQLVKKRVTGWHETPLGNRSVYKLSYRLAKTAGKHKTGIHLTGDHPVLTERGYISAEKLKKDDRIATGQGLSSTLQDLVIGMLLGDGHICHNNAHLSFSHSIKQKDYAQFKAFLLKKELGCTINKLKVRAGFKKQYPIIQCYTRADRSLWILRNDFYASKKRVPQYLKTSLNPLIVAIWFMDDGYMRIRKGGRQPRAEIATCAFTPRDINILISGLKNIGVEAYQIKNRIHFNVKAAKRLSELIAPYIPPSMRYKLHPEVEKKIAFNSNLFKLGEKGTFYDTVECKKVKHTGSDKTFFCIDVEETNNFVTSGGVVHNCRPPENRAPLPDEVETCIPFLQQQIETIKPKVIVCLGSTAFQHLLKTEEKISQTRGHWREYLGRKVMPTYHPAFLLRNPNMKRPVWEDMQEVMRVLKKT